MKESEVAQSCLTLCDPRDCSPPGSSVHGIVQARILEWVTISFSRDLPTKRSNPRLQHWQADSFHCATWEAWALLSYLFSVAENWDTDWRLIANICLCITQVTVRWSVLSYAWWRSQPLALSVSVAMSFCHSVSPSVSKMPAACSTKQRWKSWTLSALRRSPGST